MSRPDKRFHQEKVMGTAQDRNVRLFAFANSRPGYEVVFSPEQPLIVLKTKKSATEDQHPCKQWEPLSSMLFKEQPNTTHALYVADTTLFCGTPLEQEEVVNGAAVGPMMKRLGNMMAKLNPHNATMIAAGVSAHLALKYALVGERTLGHKDRYVQRVLLICPGAISPLKMMVDAALRRPRDPNYPHPEVFVLLRESAQVPAWQDWLRSLKDEHGILSDFAVTADLMPSLFAAALRESGIKADGTNVDTTQRYDVPRVYRIDFILSKQTKSVEQVPTLSPLDTLGYDDQYGSDEHEEEEDGEDDEDVEGEAARYGHGECDSSCNSHDGEGTERGEDGASVLVSGISSLDHWRDPVRVVVEGRLLNVKQGLVGTTEGRVQVSGLADLIDADAGLQAHIAKKPKGAAVLVAAALSRDGEGRSSLRALEVRPMTRAEEKRSMTVGASVGEIPASYNVSTVRKSYGALLIRGRKCALVRDLSRESHRFSGLRIPRLPHSECSESAIECAVRALCEGCEVSSDNFYRPNYIAPVMFYEPIHGGSEVRCVEVYPMLAVSPPPRGAASDAVEDAPEEDEPYDWVSFSRAQALLSMPGSCDGEKEAVTQLKDQLCKAHAAGLYTPFPGCGVFGDVVKSSSADDCAAAPAASIEGMEVIAVVCPGGSVHRAVPLIQAAMCIQNVHVFRPTSETPSALVAAARSCGADKLVVLLDAGDEGTEGCVSVDDFCEEHLVHLTEDYGATAQLFTMLLPTTVSAICDLAHSTDAGAVLLDALVEAAQSSDALLVVPETGAAHATAPDAATIALLSACAAANDDLVFFYGFDVRTPIRVEACAAGVGAGADSAVPRLARVELSCSDVPLAPAALAYLTSHGSLHDFNKPGECALLFFQGTAWVATRPEISGFISTDSSNCCLQVEEGALWEEGSAPESAIMLLVWCASEDAATAAETLARQMFEQLKWNASRDGEDWTTLRDPLPAWE